MNAKVRAMDGGSATDKVFRTLERLRQAWPKRGWSWDYRFNCAASSFHVDLTEEAERALAGVFAEVYDHRSLSRSPDYVQDLSEEVGGIRSDQRIYTTRTGGRLSPYGLWWPWGDEITISMRVGLAGYVSEQDHQRMMIEFNTLG